MKQGNKDKFKLLLEQGQILRIGKLRFRVKEIQTQSLNNEQNLMHQTDINLEIIEDHTNQELCSELLNDEKLSLNLSLSKVSCRICFSGNFTKGNPLISPCNCSGSLKYIHLQCLQQ
eukprot:TRINITY_DN43894_c0_g1_i1.p1 TRINITY_DN43894_c0_g1~~TRINITY_DN43894_c0_g1_i1.p1  ORF type:complete len:117 (-),score=13.77 TRINITY_DN43894_c0_g1_i1:225-575(-)